MKNRCINCKHLYINKLNKIGRQNGKTIISIHFSFGCTKIKNYIGVYIYYDEIVPCIIYKEGD